MDFLGTGVELGLTVFAGGIFSVSIRCCIRNHQLGSSLHGKVILVQKVEWNYSGYMVFYCHINLGTEFLLFKSLALC